MSTPATPFHKRPLWIAIAAFLALVLVAGGIAAATGAFSGGGTPAAAPTSDTTAAAEPETPASPSASALPEGAASVCGLPGYEETSSLDTAPATTWKLVGTVAVPDDPQGAGPGRTDSGGLRTCYAHTAKGALYAVVNYMGQSTDGRLRTRIADLAAQGPGKAAAAKSLASPSSSSDGRLQVAGFKISAYSGSEATVDVATAITSKGGALVSFPIVMRWEDGDWKIELADDGTLPLDPSQIQSLGGYIPWAGA
ncbi:hypothetical protein ITJ44_09005 [Clavibacter sp. VKM Ac-2873]|uniref:hypothetical protein n=1 Tax=Clavibacter sp. VKM Ac-2873 TaxID=2783813 RepID=UPI00188D2992|nr:hypothetical protein [Clavibacter sp. VKM Ac-2873]MBF4618208.1 hypothetical protein [Clavibacter sp. VKM Ac-2873]